MPQIIKISPNAVFESFDDEVIVINMVTGSYYSLDAVAMSVWKLVEQLQSLASVVEVMQSRYRGEAAEIEAAVRELVGELESEGLFVQTEVADFETESVAVAAVDENAEMPVFRKPELTKFTDMEDLLLLDPIHEVNEAGWPNIKISEEKGGA